MFRKEFYSIDEVAERMCCSHRIIRRLILTGQLKAVRLGNGPRAPYRIHESHLDDFINQQALEKQKAHERLINPQRGRSPSWQRADFY
jgi:excisionase family DNA binding protein